MKSAFDTKSIDWWLCFAILFTMGAALAGVTTGFYATIVISIIRIGVAAFSEGIASEAAIMRIYYATTYRRILCLE